MQMQLSEQLVMVVMEVAVSETRCNEQGMKSDLPVFLQAAWCCYHSSKKVRSAACQAT